MDTPPSFLLHGFEPDALVRKKALTSSGPTLSKHSEDFFQMVMALLLVILFTAFKRATSSPDTKCVAPVVTSLKLRS